MPVPWDLEEFCARVAEHTGRVLTVMPPIPAVPGGPCGLYIPTDGADYVFAVGGTSRYHREHVLLHEVGHLLCGHKGGALQATDLAEYLVPGLDAGMVKSMLGRTAYNDVQEQQAEYFATLVMLRAACRDGAWHGNPGVSTDPEIAKVLTRLQGNWGNGRAI
ncbi:hypothetical protein GCM10022254_15820 [Actinomadura meridiana]|uniref:IrrE N-terminal-like domain-containing protein n=1 Tax=Actinomadura meridiana TaxID=559626 RepID=A0ABP8BVI5_9ACTN